MTHMISVPDELYAKVATLAEERGESVEHVVEALLSRGIGPGSDKHPAGLDWETASAEDIITDLRANRVERERPVEL